MTAALSNRLAVLAGEIDTLAGAVRRDAVAWATQALALGRLLAEAKAALPHGALGAWLATNTTLSARSARRYMRLARAGFKTDTVADLGLRGALAPLTALRFPKGGEVVTGRDGGGWWWAMWKDARTGGPWFHILAVHIERGEEIATIKPLKRSAIPGQLSAFGLDVASLHFEPAMSASTAWLEEERGEIVGPSPWTVAA